MGEHTYLVYTYGLLQIFHINNIIKKIDNIIFNKEAVSHINEEHAYLPNPQSIPMFMKKYVINRLREC